MCMETNEQPKRKYERKSPLPAHMLPRADKSDARNPGYSITAENRRKIKALVEARNAPLPEFAPKWTASALVNEIIAKFEE